MLYQSIERLAWARIDLFALWGTLIENQLATLWNCILVHEDCVVCATVLESRKIVLIVYTCPEQC